jgi:hypothetical protein
MRVRESWSSAGQDTATSAGSSSFDVSGSGNSNGTLAYGGSTFASQSGGDSSSSGSGSFSAGCDLFAAPESWVFPQVSAHVWP